MNSAPSQVGFIRSSVAAMVRFLAQTVNMILLFFLLVLAFRLIFFLSPKYNALEFSVFVDRVCFPWTSFLKGPLSKLGIPPAINGINLALIALFVGIILVRSFLNRIFEGAIRALGRRAVTVPPAMTVAPEETRTDVSRRKATERLLAIQAYAEVKEILESTQQDLTFVALDVVGSTKMKIGEDPIVIEQTFINYRKLIERLLGKFQAYKCTWTPDGQMAAFKTPDLAVQFAQGVLASLPEFNQKSQMKTTFKLRVGVNSGVVSTDDATPMEKLSSFSIDLTGHLQKYAEPDSLWISERTYSQLSDKTGFVSVPNKVDDSSVYAWTIPQGL